MLFTLTHQTVPQKDLNWIVEKSFPSRQAWVEDNRVFIHLHFLAVLHLLPCLFFLLDRVA